MTYVKINGKPFDVDVAISDLEESFNVLDGPNAGRAINGGMIRDIIGTYIGHKIKFFNGKSKVIQNGWFKVFISSCKWYMKKRT